MDDRLRAFGTGLLFAVGAPVAGLAVAVGCKALIALGPDVLAGNWFGRLLLFLTGFFVGYGLILFTQLRYRNFLVFFGAFFALFFGVNVIENSLEDWVLQQRGEVTTCRVLNIDRRVETHTDSEGHTRTEVRYDYSLACADARVQAMTLGSRVSEEGELIDVTFDPDGRLSARPAASVGDPARSLWWGVRVLAVGILLRVLSELRVWPFRGVEDIDFLPPPWRWRWRLRWRRDIGRRR